MPSANEDQRAVREQAARARARRRSGGGGGGGSSNPGGSEETRWKLRIEALLEEQVALTHEIVNALTVLVRRSKPYFKIGTVTTITRDSWAHMDAFAATAGVHSEGADAAVTAAVHELKNLVATAVNLPQRSPAMLYELGNFKYDQIAGFRLPIAANGPTTGAFTATDPTGVLQLNYDGTMLTVLGIPGDADGDFTILARQPADDPGTGEVEEVAVDLHFTTSHSLATNFNIGAVELIPR